jgi:hypothetical protein
MRGVSPFTATIILVVTTIVIGVIVYNILSSYIRSAGTGSAEVQRKLEECSKADFSAFISSKTNNYMNVTLVARGVGDFNLEKEFIAWIILNDNSYIFVGNVSSSTDFGGCNTCSKITELQINITGFGEKVKGVKVQDLKCGIFTEAFI